LKRASSLRTHVSAIHHGRRPYKCTFPNCKRKFVTSYLRASHSAARRDSTATNVIIWGQNNTTFWLLDG
jgi:hypothetical protein